MRRAIIVLAFLAAGCDRRGHRTDIPPAGPSLGVDPREVGGAASQVPAVAECDAGAVGLTAGRRFTAALAEQARARAGAGVVRAIRPGDIITTEHLAARLNLRLNDRDEVIEAYCG